MTLRSACAPVAAQLRRIVVPAPPRSCSPCPPRFPLPAGFPLHVFFPICVKPTLEASRREPGPSCVTQTALKAAFALGEAGRPGSGDRSGCAVRGWASGPSGVGGRQLPRLLGQRAAGMTRGQCARNSRSDGRPTATAFPPRKPGPAFSRWRGRPFWGEPEQVHCALGAGASLPLSFSFCYVCWGDGWSQYINSRGTPRASLLACGCGWGFSRGPGRPSPQHCTKRTTLPPLPHSAPIRAK